MSITVKDVLELDLLRGAKIVAGGKGLDREVERVNFTDCPISFDESEFSLVGAGDLFLCSFFLVRDDEAKLYEAIYFYISSMSSCCIIADAYFRDHKLPSKVIELANKNKYPLIMIPDDVQYGELVKEISEMIIIGRSEIVVENKINQLIYDALSEDQVSALARRLNHSFQSIYAACYLACNTLDRRQLKMVISALQKNSNLQPLQYKKDYLFVLINFRKPKSLSTHISYIRSILNMYHLGSIGISNEFEKIDLFHQCLRQAMSSFEMARITDEAIVYYDEVSIYNLLYSIQNPSPLKEFCKKMIAPLVEYGNHHKIDMVCTIETYLRNDGDYKKTASEMFTHENTVRFRIGKAKSILGFENSHFKFIEHMSIAIKCKKLLDVAVAKTEQ